MNLIKSPITESSLHAIYGIAEHIDTDERDYMPLCMALISTIPFDRLNEKVLGIALDTIGKIMFSRILFSFLIYTFQLTFGIFYIRIFHTKKN